MLKSVWTLAAVASMLAPVSLAVAASATFDLLMDGAQEAPGPGDPDGSAVGTIAINDVTGVISWNITYQNIAPPTMMHLHHAGDGIVVVDLGVSTSGGPGTLIDSIIHSPLSDLQAILDHPHNYYLNLHTAEFENGAVRDQLGFTIPATSTWGLVSFAGGLIGAGGVIILRRSRKHLASPDFKRSCVSACPSRA